MKFASGFYLPSPLFHLQPQLFDEFGNLLSPFLFPFVLDLSSLVFAMIAMARINQLGRWGIGWRNGRDHGGSRRTSRCSGSRGIGSPKGQLVLVWMKAIDGFSVMIRVWIVLNGKAQASLVLHEIGSQFNGCIKQVKGWKASGRRICSVVGFGSSSGICLFHFVLAGCTRCGFWTIVGSSPSSCACSSSS